MDGFIRRTIAAIGLATLAMASAVLVWRGIDVLLLVFAGVLLALFLRGLAGRTARLTGLRDGAAVAVVVVVLAALTGVGGWLIAPPVAGQASELVQRLSEAVGRVREGLAESPWGQRVLSYLPGPDDLRPSEIVQRAGGTLVTTLGWFLGGVANVGVIMFIGVYVAFAPEPYARGFL